MIEDHLQDQEAYMNQIHGQDRTTQVNPILDIRSHVTIQEGYKTEDDQDQIKDLAHHRNEDHKCINQHLQQKRTQIQHI